MKGLNELIYKEKNGINNELFRKNFSFQRPSEILKAVYNANDAKENNDLINVIKSGLSDLKGEIEKMKLKT